MEYFLFFLLLKLYVVCLRAIAWLVWKSGFLAGVLQAYVVFFVVGMFGVVPSSSDGAAAVVFVLLCTTVLYHIASRVRGLTPRVIDPVVPLLHHTGLPYAALAYFGECWALNVNGLAESGGIPVSILAPQSWPLAILPTAIVVAFTVRSVRKWRAGR